MSTLNKWDKLYAKGQGCGPASTEVFTRGFRGFLANTIRTLGVKRVIDYGCGDWQWQRHCDWNGISYLGIDIAKTVIEKNQREFPQHKFRVWDWTMKPEIRFLPNADLLLVKDLIHHISKIQIERMIERACHYPHVLWVVDVENGKVCRAEDQQYFNSLKKVFIFDPPRDYIYGPKVALYGRS